MARHTYEEVLRRLLVHEGGYTDHPADPGGPTNWGITIHDARQYWKADATAEDVRAMPVEVAKGIYRSKYWGRLRCDALPAGVDYCVFDYGVNSGTARSAKVLQRVLEVEVSGAVDDRTILAARARDSETVIAAICDERLRFLQGLRTWPVFGAGWGRRVREVRAAALRMAQAVPATEPASGPSAGKGAAPLNRAGRNTTTGAIVAGGTIAAQQAHQAGARPAVIALIVVTTIALAIAGAMLWRWRQRHQQEKPA